MAYRKLNFGDHVRVIQSSSPFNGCNAIVIGEDGNTYKVQVNQGGRATTFWVMNDNLLVRDDKYAFIVDGRLDADAQQAHEAEIRRRFLERDVDEDEDDDYEPCGTCPCCEAHNR